MNYELLTQLMVEMLLVVMQVAGPILVISLLTGVVISILQVVTQIQDISLTFVPKLLVVFLTMLFAGDWMLKKIVGFATNAINNIPALF